MLLYIYASVIKAELGYNDEVEVDWNTVKPRWDGWWYVLDNKHGYQDYELRIVDGRVMHRSSDSEATLRDGDEDFDVYRWQTEMEFERAYVATCDAERLRLHLLYHSERVGVYADGTRWYLGTRTRIHAVTNLEITRAVSPHYYDER